MSIRKLIEAVEAGQWPADFLAADVGVFGVTTARMYESFSGSIDAALALTCVVLPGVPVSLHDMSPEYLGGEGWVAKVNWPHVAWQPTFTAAGPFGHEGRAETPSRALLLATLKAMEQAANK